MTTASISTTASPATSFSRTSSSNTDPATSTKPLLRKQHSHSRSSSVRHDSIGGAHGGHGHGGHHDNDHNFDSLTYVKDESDVWRAMCQTEHYSHRGNFWNEGKHLELMTYVLMGLVGILQASVAYFTNLTSNFFIENKYDHINSLLQDGHTFWAFVRFVSIQFLFAMMASLFVWIEPVSAGSGIPEVKCYLNGIDLPRVGNPKTLLCKVLGVICSVSAGLPVGKEGPMVHSGAVVATTVSSGRTRNDREKRDFVACGAAAGVCTAFSAPIGGILFALEEGTSYWSQSLTWKTFFCSMLALSALYMLNSIGSQFGKVGFNKLFSFGNFVFEDGGQSSFAVFELVPFVVIGIIGGLIGAVFNDTNHRITIWRIKRINHSKRRRLVEVGLVSMLVSIVSFLLPLAWHKCRPLPDSSVASEWQIESLVAFGCKAGEEYNEMASLMFTDPGDAIRLLFHLHHHAFSNLALFVFFIFYISLAVVVYGIAVPSGLFVPSLLSGAAFGRLFGNLAHTLYPGLAYSNTYALIGAAAVLGGMARMTISLTVILLECTGNEQFVLPLMMTLMTSRVVGGRFNDDLYHIHIHLKKGIQFLEAELKSITRHHTLVAGQVMSENVVFVKPVDKVGVIHDILTACEHTNFPVVDTDDNGVLYGTIGRSALCILLQQRAFGYPQNGGAEGRGAFSCNYLKVGSEKFYPLVEWDQIEKVDQPPLAKYLRLSDEERECLVDLRPYANTAPLTIQESSSVARTYQLFRSIGMRFLPVVNSHNQVVGTITRTDLTPEALADTMLHKGKKKD